MDGRTCNRRHSPVERNSLSQISLNATPERLKLSHFVHSVKDAQY